jgi:hypothetical protein
MKFPKALGTCADKLYALKEEKRKVKKEIDDIEAKEKALRAHIINNLPKSKASGIVGKVGKVEVVVKEVPRAVDRIKLNKYIQKTGEFDLLNSGLKPTAFQARWEDGKVIPGVEKFNVVTVSLTKK